MGVETEAYAYSSITDIFFVKVRHLFQRQRLKAHCLVPSLIYILGSTLRHYLLENHIPFFKQIISYDTLHKIITSNVFIKQMKSSFEGALH